MDTLHEKKISRKLLLVMAIASGITVANIYYIQPLLNDIAGYFDISGTHAGLMATLTQLGYAAGLFLILPAADCLSRKKLIMWMLLFSMISLGLMTISHTFVISAFICCLVGLTSIVPQLIVPFAAELSPAKDRGKNIGTVMSGLLTGILASRVVSGLVGNMFGWKSVYIMALILIAVVALVLWKMLPGSESSSSVRYVQSLRSLFTLPGKYPVLAASAVNGALIFAVFSAFWTVLTFYLSDSFHYGSDITGLFGLFGISGAVLAPVAGKMSDRRGASFTVGFHLAVIIIAFAVFALFGKAVPGIIAGVILLDYGVQCCNVANQSRIQALSSEERNRITSVYMVSFFLGGSIGSSLGAAVYEHFGWYGFVVAGSVISLAAIMIHFAANRIIASR